MKKTTKTESMYLVVVMSSCIGSKGTSPLKQTMRLFPTLEQAMAYGKRAAKKEHDASLLGSGRAFVLRPEYVQISAVSGNAAPKLLRNPYGL